MIKIKCGNIGLKNTITCGQIFRYYEELDSSYTIILSDRIVNIKQIDDYLYVNSNNNDNLETIIKEYLDLNRDYDTIINNIKKLDNNMSKYLDKSIGLRIIKQTPLECIISYVISQNNSVNNIRNSLNLISKYYGKEVIFNNKKYYLFPDINKLSTINLSDFRKCKVGFRDKYLVDIIDSIKSGRLNIDLIYSMSSKDALDYLMSFKGIGMKVASCILLFAYQKYDVYPVDTWVKKFMESEYNIIGEKNIRDYTEKTFREYSGLAIQYMFNSKRNL